MIRRVNASLPAGKLNPALLARLLAQLPVHDPALLVGPAVGEDAAVIDFAPGAPHVLVAKGDPITFATDAIGYYAVNVCANDLAVTGARPRFYMPTLLLPAGDASPALVERIFAEIGAACRALGIVVAGGHSEITHAVNQPVIAGHMLGEANRGRYYHSGGCRPGDVLLLAGAIPVEAASIIARERRADLLAQGWMEAEIDTAANLLHNPGISVLAPAQAAVATGCITAMHDPTEGGVATGIQEIAVAAQVDITVNLDAIPIHPLGERLCAAYALDPLGAIASGSLLATCSAADATTVLEAWHNIGWHGAVIGVVTAPAAQTPIVTAKREGACVPFPHFSADEITRLWT